MLYLMTLLLKPGVKEFLNFQLKAVYFVAFVWIIIWFMSGGTIFLPLFVNPMDWHPIVKIIFIAYQVFVYFEINRKDD